METRTQITQHLWHKIVTEICARIVAAGCSDAEVQLGIEDSNDG
jgi:hypothetical protein